MNHKRPIAVTIEKTLLIYSLKNYLIMNFIWYILIGLVAGFAAGKLVHGSGFGLIVNIIVGIIGGVLGGWLFGLLGLSASSIIGNLITSVVGSIVLLWIVGFLSRSIK